MWRREVRAVRGATTIAVDEPCEVLAATRELLREMLERNGAHQRDLVSAMFTATPDVRSEAPAVAARQLGWTDVPLLCAQEMAVAGGLPRCIRVLLHVTTRRTRAQVAHVYLREARGLRADLTGAGGSRHGAASVGAGELVVSR